MTTISAVPQATDQLLRLWQKRTGFVGWFGVPAESGGLKLVQIVVTILALSLIAGAGYNVYKLWRTTRRSAGDDASVPGYLIEPGSLEQTVAAYTPFAALDRLLQLCGLPHPAA